MKKRGLDAWDGRRGGNFNARGGRGDVVAGSAMSLTEAVGVCLNESDPDAVAIPQ